MTETRIVLSVIAASSCVRIDPPVAVDRQLDDLEAELLEVAQGVADGVVLDRRRHDPVAARLAGPGRALDREVVGLGAAGREDDLARLGVEPARRPARGPRRGPPGPAGRRRGRTPGCRTRSVRNGSIASRTSRAQRGRRGVVEVDRHRPGDCTPVAAGGHGAPLTRGLLGASRRLGRASRRSVARAARADIASAAAAVSRRRGRDFAATAPVGARSATRHPVRLREPTRQARAVELRQVEHVDARCSAHAGRRVDGARSPGRRRGPAPRRPRPAEEWTQREPAIDGLRRDRSLRPARASRASETHARSSSAAADARRLADRLPASPRRTEARLDGPERTRSPRPERLLEARALGVARLGRCGPTPGRAWPEPAIEKAP